jgi:hypothetical protein
MEGGDDELDDRERIDETYHTTKLGGSRTTWEVSFSSREVRFLRMTADCLL